MNATLSTNDYESIRLKILEEIIKNIFLPKIRGLEEVSYLTNGEKLILADVGSTGGLQKTWRPLRNMIKTYSFDPDERAIEDEGKCEVFRVALWRCEDKKDLYLTKFPAASSLKLPNKKILDSFPNMDDHEVISKKKIKVVKMDDVLSSHKAPDFIKIDAEGSDFEILQGSETTLRRNCLGLQVEVQFVERNVASTNFGTKYPGKRERNSSKKLSAKSEGALKCATPDTGSVTMSHMEMSTLKSCGVVDWRMRAKRVERSWEHKSSPGGALAVPNRLCVLPVPT